MITIICIAVWFLGMFAVLCFSNLAKRVRDIETKLRKIDVNDVAACDNK